MSSIEEAKAKYLEVKKDVERCQNLLVELTKRHDSIQEEMPKYKTGIEEAAHREVNSYDDYVLGKIGEKELLKIKSECQAGKVEYAESLKILDSLGRAITRTESDLQRLNAKCDLAKRQTWQSVFDSIKAGIPETVFDSIRKMQVIGSQCSQTRQWILDSLFVNPSSGEHQELCAELARQYQIE